MKQNKEKKNFNIKGSKAVFFSYFIVRILAALSLLGGILSIIRDPADSSNGALVVLQSLWILVLLFIPSFVNRRLKIEISSSLEFVLVLFVFASLFLGEMSNFYELVPFWDKMLHGLSGFIIGAIGLSMIIILNDSDKITLKLSPTFMAVFIFCFALASGAVWEIIEFSSDRLFGTNMQVLETGVEDTMWDIIADSSGALVFAVIGYFYRLGKMKFLNNFLLRPMKFKTSESANPQNPEQENTPE